MTDPIDRIIEIIFRAQGGMTLDSLCTPGAKTRLRRRCEEELEREVEAWFQAKWKLAELEESDGFHRGTGPGA